MLDSGQSEELIVNADGSNEVKASTAQGLLDATSRVLLSNSKLEFESYGVGPKSIPGDGEPVFGSLQNVPGCYVAFSHSGATLGPIAGGSPHPLLAALRQDRFS